MRGCRATIAAKSALTQLEGCRRHRRDDGRRAQLARQEGHLADHVSPAQAGERGRLAAPAGADHVGEPVRDDEQAVARVACPADELVALELPRAHAARELVELGFGQTFEERVPRERRHCH